MIQFILRSLRPRIYGLLTTIIYRSKNVKIGDNLRCDSIPHILIDKSAQLILGNNIELRRNVEIRVHQNSEVIIESQVRIDRGVRILSANAARVYIAEKVRIGLYSVLNGGDSIVIGSASLISGFVYSNKYA